MHTWLATQTEGWWRYAFDHAGVPYDYISTQTARQAKTTSARKYDVIVFAPVSRASAQDILNGMPAWHNPMPWQKTDLTPNLGHRLDRRHPPRPRLRRPRPSEKIRRRRRPPHHLRRHRAVRHRHRPRPRRFAHPPADARVVGTVLNTVFVARDQPLANGYDLNVPAMSADGMAFNISNTVGHSGGRLLMDPYAERPTGRGSLEENDEPQGRKITEAEPLQKQQPWEARKLNEEQMRNNPSVIPPEYRPDVILRFTDAKTMLLSGLLDKAGSIAEHAIVVECPPGQRQRAALRQQPHLPRRNSRHLRPRVQRHPQPRPSRPLSTVHRAPLVANLHPWETRTKAEKKPRKLPSPNRNQSLAADQRSSRRRRQNNDKGPLAPRERPRTWVPQVSPPRRMRPGKAPPYANPPTCHVAQRRQLAASLSKQPLGFSESRPETLRVSPPLPSKVLPPLSLKRRPAISRR